MFVRRGHNGAERLVGGGLVGAAFRHRTSRAGDPQVHTHVVVANAAQGPDGALVGAGCPALVRACPYGRVPLPIRPPRRNPPHGWTPTGNRW